MAERTLGEWLRQLELIHPQEIDLGLERVRHVAQALDLLPYAPQTLIVAGTNGKGSVVYSSEAILRAHGRRTGRYTSPHLLRFNERIAIDGEPVENAAIVSAFEVIDGARGDTTLTYFEFATLAALWLFREHSVDTAVLEVGLGGRLDAVNIVDADAAVITAIDLDHQQWLGDTVELIAPEKAAVARAGRPAILAEPSYPATLVSSLDAIGARILAAGERWCWQESDDGSALDLRLYGDEREFSVPQPTGLRTSNVAAATQACACLLGSAFSVERVSAALAQLQVPARRQCLSWRGRELILDVAHNPAAMEALVAFVRQRPVAGQTLAVFGAMGDKDLAAMTAQLASVVDGACALAIPGIDRAASPEQLWEYLDAAGIAVPQGEFSADAVWAQLEAGTDLGDRIVVCGSFHTIAGIMPLLSPPA